MRKTRVASLRKAVGLSLAAALLGCGPGEHEAPGREPLEPATASKALATYTDWPAITSAIPKDPVMESQIAQIVAGMTLAQKIGQMTQPTVFPHNTATRAATSTRTSRASCRSPGRSRPARRR